MSERHRQTYRVHRSTTRYQQVGGGSQLHHISDTVRAPIWNATLSAKPDLKMFAGVITEPNWGNTLSSSQKLELYINLVERQDELFSTALDIIYRELGIDRTADNLESVVIEKSGIIESNQENLKQYLNDIYTLVTCGIDHPKDKKTNQKNFQKHTLFIDEPLSNILMWPERVKNIFVRSIAKILVALKQNPRLLDSTKGKPYLQSMFADIYNTFIQSEILKATSKGLRDGFYLWQALPESIITADECADVDMKSCVPKTGSRSLWGNFCSSYFISNFSVFVNLGEGRLLNTNLFSAILADIFKLYKLNNANSIRKELSTKFPSQIVASVSDTPYRPKLAESDKTQLGAMMRQLHPEQYTFIFHLLYLMGQIEAETETEAEAAPETEPEPVVEPVAVVGPVVEPVSSMPKRVTLKSRRAIPGSLPGPRRLTRSQTRSQPVDESISAP
jgi:hypothetical protein